MGQQVSAYDPATGKTKTETITRVFLNHDTDRLDVTLATQTPVAAPASATTASPAQAGHGRRAFGSASTTMMATATTATATQTEVVHTTANHPWLTADHGWLVAGNLHVGEPVRLLDGATAWVVALHTLAAVLCPSYLLSPMPQRYLIPRGGSSPRLGQLVPLRRVPRRAPPLPHAPRLRDARA